MAVTIDLHTHAHDSPDGSLGLVHYEKMLAQGVLDYIAITSHNSIMAAQYIHQKLGHHIIIGEEIMTQEGEIIGLYLDREVPAGMTLEQTVHAIKQQEGIVYVPHPFETRRHGLQEKALRRIAADIDIVEAYNGRAVIQNRTNQAVAWAQAHNKPIAASSDAHGWHGWGRTYSVLPYPPTQQNLPSLLREATFKSRFPGIRALLYPSINRMRHRNA